MGGCVTLTWNGRRFDWANVAYFAAIHGLALLAPWYFSWSALGVCLVLTWLAASLGIGMTYHRLLTHRSFRVPKPFEYLFTIAGMLASEGGAVTWVAMHRMHHQLSDRAGRDPHTPKDGFWWSHFGWILCDMELTRRQMQVKYAADLMADPVHRALNAAHLLPNILLGVALYALGGMPWLIWGTFVRTVLVLHATWFVNSATHTWGYRTYSTPEDSRNLWWVGLIAWGEGWHNNHHAFQRSARHGLEWYELDVNWILISGLAALGIATDIQLLPRGAERFRLDQEEPLLAENAA
jgi:stearoyl-CoA desaturase (delta-9 desaturase)